jgi:hypothetical protein
LRLREVKLTTPAAEPDPAWEALRALIDQIEGGGYQDRDGRPLEHSAAFLEASALVRADADA